MNQDIEQTFCQNFKIFVEKNYPRQEYKLAQKLGISAQQLANIKQGRRVGTESWRRWAADQLGLKYSQLIGLEGESGGESVRNIIIDVVNQADAKEIEAQGENYRSILLHEAGDLVSGLDGRLTLGNTGGARKSIIVDHLELEERANHDLRALRIPDDSMWPRVPEGSLVFLDLDDRRFVDNAIYVVRDPFSDPPRAILRSVRRLEQASYRGFAFVSENQRYLPEMSEHNWDMLVAGRAVWVWRSLEGAQLQPSIQQTQKMEAIDWLAGGIAHDLNNFLSPIFGYGEMALAHAGDNETLKKQINRIIEAGRGVKALARQLLAFSRQRLQEFTPVNLNRLLQNAEQRLRSGLRNEIDFHLDLAASLPDTSGDQGQLEQVVLNLVVNAQEAMPNGGELAVRTAAVELDEAYVLRKRGVTPGRYVLLSVSDTGKGMDAETLEHIFEPFFTTKQRDRSAGLGLSTAYGVVKQHGGNIWAYSEPGLGSVIKVYLPAALDKKASFTETNAVEAAEKETLPEPGHSATILLAEDEAIVRELISTILKDHGYHVLAGESKAAAISALSRHGGPVDLLLTDVILPDGNGKELFQELNDHDPNLRVLYMSGYTENVIIHHGILKENMNFIEKPFNSRDLIEKIKAVLHRSVQGEYPLT